MRLSRKTRKTISAILVLFVPIICAVVLVAALGEFTPKWTFSSKCNAPIDEQLCYKCRGYYQ